ncbi:aliphatic sulfonate ABC transporter [Listeria floridensis FSL S10-1187]|uniref:Aliphatic sulfonate ABC transporter n=1 Tax=Listeria floridensis FSL S10-1187 TaxID=1265817 RepID=A0ABP3AXE3_9LIST|nr:ABC transporter permease [Listeria floridensis]EUJ31279.1 aliphatic sulfonate ABC transporter [Listeria floridensis FSL S10-1187]
MKKQILSAATGLVGLFLIWEASHLILQSPVVPAPHQTLLEFFISLPELLPHTLSSLYRILVAILVSLLIGIPLGIWIGESKWANRLLSPLLYFLYPIPKVAFLPVFLILYGLGDLSKIILIIWIIVFQIILSTRDGIAQIDPKLYLALESLEAKPFDKWRHLLFPAILPQILSGLRVCIGIALATLFFAENYATTYGLGYYIMNAWSVIDYPDMFCGILMLSLLGFLLFQAIDWLERLLVPWQTKKR